MIKNDPLVKELFKMKKVYLVTMTKQRGLSCHGKKIELAFRIAESEYERFIRDWDAISNKKG